MSRGVQGDDDILGPSRARKCVAKPPCDGPCITVRVAAGGPTIPWGELRGYERNTLKSRKPRDLERLGGAILDRTGKGFAFPVFVWEGHRYVIDGAGRVPSLEWLEEQGHVIPARIPVSEIQAESETEAAELVMLASSHHGDVTEESAAKFAELHRLQLAAIAPMLRFQGVEIEQVAQRQSDALAGLRGQLPEQIAAPTKDFHLMSFTVHASQKDSVESALRLAIERGLGVSEVNENKNGNALYGICSAFLAE
jgi:hypothetical protein